MSDHSSTANDPSATAAGSTPDEVRRLLHDMNNGLEIIIQATYLIGTLELTPDGRQWLKLLEQGVEQVANLNKDLREKIRGQIA